MDKSLIAEIISKFLDGNCSDEEFAYLLYWYESFDGNAQVAMTEEERELLRVKILNRIKSNIPAIQRSEKNKRRIRVHIEKNIFFKGWKYAAAAIFIGIIAWLGIAHVGQKSSASMEEIQQVQADRGWVALNNRTSQVRLIVLPDSSKVWLNPGSSIHYHAKFVAAEREIELAGEAFFDIHHDASHPFVVVSQHLITTVLGTSFLIKANVKGTSEVTVVSGKVSVEKRHQSRSKIVLVAKQSAVLNAENKLRKETVADKGALEKWQQVNLSFNSVPFAQVIQVLDEKFGVQIYCQEDKIYQYQLNADFTNQNLADILKMLGMSLNIQYKMINDSTISFYGTNKQTLKN